MRASIAVIVKSYIIEIAVQEHSNGWMLSRKTKTHLVPCRIQVRGRISPTTHTIRTFFRTLVPAQQPLCPSHTEASIPFQAQVMATTEPNPFMHSQPLSELNEELRGLICSVSDLECHTEKGNLSGEDVKAALREMFTDSMLFSRAVKTIPAIYPAIRN